MEEITTELDALLGLYSNLQLIRSWTALDHLEPEAKKKYDEARAAFLEKWGQDSEAETTTAPQVAAGTGTRCRKCGGFCGPFHCDNRDS
jgi:hypothetical protein